MVYDFIKTRLNSAVDSLANANKAFKGKDYKTFSSEVIKIVLFYAVIIIIAFIIITTGQRVFNFATSISNNTIAMIGIALVFIFVYVLPRLKVPDSLGIPTIAEMTKNSETLRKALYFATDEAFTKSDLDVNSDSAMKLVGSTQFNLIGTTPMYHYRARKGKNCSLIAEEVEEILQDELEHRETNHLLPFSDGNFYSYNGRQFCPILVMDVREDSRFFYIDLAIATDRACHKWLMRKSSDDLEVSNEDEEI